jgi:hypothetical protein
MSRPFYFIALIGIIFCGEYKLCSLPLCAWDVRFTRRSRCHVGLMGCCPVWTSALKMEVVCSSETLVSTYKTDIDTRQNVIFTNLSLPPSWVEIFPSAPCSNTLSLHFPWGERPSFTPLQNKRFNHFCMCWSVGFIKVQDTQNCSFVISAVRTIQPASSTSNVTFRWLIAVTIMSLGSPPPAMCNEDRWTN